MGHDGGIFLWGFGLGGILVLFAKWGAWRLRERRLFEELQRSRDLTRGLLEGLVDGATPEQLDRVIRRAFETGDGGPVQIGLPRELMTYPEMQAERAGRGD